MQLNFNRRRIRDMIDKNIINFSYMNIINKNEELERKKSIKNIFQRKFK